MLYHMMDIALAVLLALPLFLLYVYAKQLQHEVLQWSHVLFFINIIIIKVNLSYSETFYQIIWLQFMTVWPIVALIITYVYLREGQSFNLSLLLTGTVGTVVVIVLFVVSIPIKNDVEVVHKAFATGYIEADDRAQYIIYNSLAPSTLFADNLQLFGEIEQTFLPWKSVITVNHKAGYQRYTYTRFDQGWKLEGSYEKQNIIK